MSSGRRRCIILDDFQGVALAMADWSVLADQADVTALRHHLDSEDELVAALGDAHVVVAMRERTPLRASLLARLPHLELIVTSGMRNAAIDVGAAKARGIAVSGTASRSEPPAELTWALILGLARHLVSEAGGMRAGGWQRTVGVGLHGKRLGVIGLGKIGSRVATIGRAFGMDVIAWSPHLSQERCEAAGATQAATLDELLTTSDVVTLHLVVGEGTRGILGAAQIDRLRPGALLINTARAALVDQAAMIAALASGRIAGAGLDVFDLEPLPAEHPLRTLPNVLATPHLGYVVDDNYRIYFGEVVEDIQAWLSGEPIRLL